MSKLSDLFKGVFKAASVLGTIFMIAFLLLIAASSVPPGQGNDNIGGRRS